MGVTKLDLCNVRCVSSLDLKAVRRDSLYQNNYLLNSNSVSIFSVAPELDSQNTHACGGLRTPKRILSDAVPLLRDAGDYMFGAFEMIVDWLKQPKNPSRVH